MRGPGEGRRAGHLPVRQRRGGHITYLTGGNARFPKETMDATGGGRSARLDNFRKATVWSGRGKSATKARGGQDKGQRSEMAAFVEACRTGAAMPISVDSLLATTRATIAVRREPAERRAGAGMSAEADVPARLVCPAARQDVACRGGVACPRAGAAAGLARAAGDAGSSSAAAAPLAAPASAAFTAVLPPGTAARVPERGPGGDPGGADRLLRG